MKITVIIPTYNRVNTILRAMKSVLTQTHQAYECWIIDDGSTDETEKVIKKFISEHKLANFFYLKTANQGVSAARNLGVKKANGEWLAFLDSDDEWLPEKLAVQVKFLKLHPNYELVFTDEIWIRNNVKVNQKKKHRKCGGDLLERSMEQCLIGPSTVLMKKSLFLKLGGFREDFPVCEDYDLWLKVLAQFSVGFVPQALINKYGGHADQLSRQTGMDYYRVKSLEHLLQTASLTLAQTRQAQIVLHDKCKILLTGYQKHHNFKYQQEITQLFLGAQAMLGISPSHAQVCASLV